MTLPRGSDTARARKRAAAAIDHDVDKQDDIRQLIHQIALVLSVAVGDDDDTEYLIVQGAHGAGFRIAIAISAAGQIGWTLV